MGLTVEEVEVFVRPVSTGTYPNTCVCCLRFPREMVSSEGPTCLYINYFHAHSGVSHKALIAVTICIYVLVCGGIRWACETMLKYTVHTVRHD